MSESSFQILQGEKCQKSSVARENFLIFTPTKMSAQFDSQLLIIYHDYKLVRLEEATEICQSEEANELFQQIVIS